MSVVPKFKMVDGEPVAEKPKKPPKEPVKKIDMLEFEKVKSQFKPVKADPRLAAASTRTKAVKPAVASKFNPAAPGSKTIAEGVADIKPAGYDKKARFGNAPPDKDPTCSEWTDSCETCKRDERLAIMCVEVIPAAKCFKRTKLKCTYRQELNEDAMQAIEFEDEEKTEQRKNPGVTITRYDPAADADCYQYYDGCDVWRKATNADATAL